MIHSIKINNFRNYNKFELQLASGINIILGSNGSGKTNILEAIYTSLLTKSFKKVSDETLLNRNSDYFRLEIKNNDDIYVYYYDKNNKKVFINDKLVSRLSEFLKENKVIFFGPDDMYLIKGTPKERRNYLNLELSQFDKLYLNELIEYNKILQNKKKYLKNENIDINLLEIYNNQLLNYSLNIINKRKLYINLLNGNINKLWHKFYSDFNIYIDYEVKNIDIDNITEDTLRKAYQNILEKEIKYHTTLLGPHLDDLIIKMNDIDVIKMASEGQIKLIILAIKLTEIQIFNKKFDINPIILLDDLFSELDSVNCNKILDLINNKSQIIITTPDLNGIDQKIMNNAKIINLEGDKNEQ